MKGIQAHNLAPTPTNFMHCFPFTDTPHIVYSEKVTKSQKQAIDTFINLGSIFKVGYENMNIGRALWRTLYEFPVAEQVAKLMTKKEDYKYLLTFIMMLTYMMNKTGKHNPYKAFGISKDMFLVIINNPRNFLNYIEPYTCKMEWNIDELKELIGTPIDNLKLADLSDDRVIVEKPAILVDAKQLSQSYHIIMQDVNILSKYSLNTLTTFCKQVDKERGYHDGTSYAKDLFEMISSGYEYSKFAECLDKLGDRPIDLKNMVKYMYRSLYHQQALSISESLSIMLDYYRLVYSIKGFNKYPRYIKTAHDIASRNLKEVRDAHNRNLVLKTYHKYVNKLQFAFGKYVMIVLASPYEIIQEGTRMSNCVGGYVDAVSLEESIICSLRHQEDKDTSWVTVEFSPRDGKLTLVQAYGKYDNPLDLEQRSALTTFCKHFGYGIKDSIGGGSNIDKNSLHLSYRYKLADENEYHEPKDLVYDDSYLKVQEQTKDALESIQTA